MQGVRSEFSVLQVQRADGRYCHIPLGVGAWVPNDSPLETSKQHLLSLRKLKLCLTRHFAGHAVWEAALTQPFTVSPYPP